MIALWPLIQVWDQIKSNVLTNSHPLLEFPEENQQERLTHMKAVLALLPQGNIAVLKRMLGYLRQCADKHEINKMNTKNLATVFGPNIIRPRDDDLMKQLADGKELSLPLLLTLSLAPSFPRSPSSLSLSSLLPHLSFTHNSQRHN